jgi:hypothetical protein
MDLDHISGGLGDLMMSPARRSYGSHVSDVLRDIDNRLINVGQRPTDHDMSPQEIRRMGPYREAGFIWELVFEHFWGERMLTRHRGRNVIKGAELEKDGIFGSPDGIMECVGEPDRIQEYKWTSRSSKRVANFATDFRNYIMQLKSYCYMAETPYADLYLFFAAGDYDSSGPQPRHFSITFSMRELKAHWEMLLRHRDKYMGKI